MGGVPQDTSFWNGIDGKGSPAEAKGWIWKKGWREKVLLPVGRAGRQVGRQAMEWEVGKWDVRKPRDKKLFFVRVLSDALGLFLPERWETGKMSLLIQNYGYVVGLRQPLREYELGLSKHVVKEQNNRYILPEESNDRLKLGMKECLLFGSLGTEGMHAKISGIHRVEITERVPRRGFGRKNGAVVPRVLIGREVPTASPTGRFLAVGSWGGENSHGFIVKGKEGDRVLCLRHLISYEPEDNSEPENLSTKPEDLIRTSSSVHQYYKSLTPPLGVTPVSSAVKTPTVDGSSGVHSPSSAPTPRPPTPPQPVVSSPTAVTSSSLTYPYQHHTGAFTPIHYPKPVGGPLEPLNLNTAHAEHLHYWPRSGAAPLAPYHPPPPPSYLHFGYHPAAAAYHHHHHHHHPATPSYLTPPGHDQLSPYAPPRDSAPSPPSPLPPPPPPAPSINRPTYVPATHPLVATLPQQPRLYMPYLTSNSTSPDLPEYYSRTSPVHTIPASNPLPPPTPEEDGDENARPTVVDYVPHNNHPAPPSPPLSSSTVEDLSSPATPPSDSAPTSVSPIPVPPKKQKSTSSARHQCTDCSKSYSTFSGLSKHRQFHCKGANGASGNGGSGGKKSKASGANGEPAATFSCKHCDKTYVSLGALKMHIRTHTLPCECKLCGKAFSRPWLLQGHIRTHTGEKPFSCPHCCRAFADRSNLRAHLQTHSDVKKYSCPRCARTFSRMSLLAKHADGGCMGNVNNNNNVAINNNNLVNSNGANNVLSDVKVKSEEMMKEMPPTPVGDYYHGAVRH
ncbi:hypothetical protein J437_LFUL005259 [Ladona fulva]|uniref:C2H2-type domain-containing protein n=1 Tax=Ladona fulva TaxID=123851 RepID=A0A8K0NVH0_LADFU|nr:hypothetical protein J437_LFUL005259 [Ladona fulva]